MDSFLLLFFQNNFKNNNQFDIFRHIFWLKIDFLFSSFCCTFLVSSEKELTCEFLAIVQTILSQMESNRLTTEDDNTVLSCRVPFDRMNHLFQLFHSKQYHLAVVSVNCLCDLLQALELSSAKMPTKEVQKKHN